MQPVELVHGLDAGRGDQPGPPEHLTLFGGLEPLKRSPVEVGQDRTGNGRLCTRRRTAGPPRLETKARGAGLRSPAVPVELRGDAQNRDHVCDPANRRHHIPAPPVDACDEQLVFGARSTELQPLELEGARKPPRPGRPRRRTSSRPAGTDVGRCARRIRGRAARSDGTQAVLQRRPARSTSSRAYRGRLRPRRRAPAGPRYPHPPWPSRRGPGKTARPG